MVLMGGSTEWRLSQNCGTCAAGASSVLLAVSPAAARVQRMLRVLQDDHIPGVQRLSSALEDRDVGEAPHLHQLDVRLLQDHDPASGRQAGVLCYMLV